MISILRFFFILNVRVVVWSCQGYYIDFVAYWSLIHIRTFPVGYFHPFQSWSVLRQVLQRWKEHTRGSLMILLFCCGPLRRTLYGIFAYVLYALFGSNNTLFVMRLAWTTWLDGHLTWNNSKWEVCVCAKYSTRTVNGARVQFSSSRMMDSVDFHELHILYHPSTSFCTFLSSGCFPNYGSGDNMIFWSPLHCLCVCTCLCACE